MEQCQKIERVTRFGIYFPIRLQPDKAGIPYVPADWGIKNSLWKRYHMKKNTILWLAASAVVMLVFPWLSSVFCSQSIIFRADRSICGKGHPALMEPSGYFDCAVPHRHMGIL